MRTREKDKHLPQFNIRLSDADRARWRAFADDKKLFLSQLIRMGVEYFIADNTGDWSKIDQADEREKAWRLARRKDKEKYLYPERFDLKWKYVPKPEQQEGNTLPPPPTMSIHGKFVITHAKTCKCQLCAGKYP